jgi:hypothetical protein
MERPSCISSASAAASRRRRPHALHACTLMPGVVHCGGHQPPLMRLLLPESLQNPTANAVPTETGKRRHTDCLTFQTCIVGRSGGCKAAAPQLTLPHAPPETYRPSCLSLRVLDAAGTGWCLLSRTYPRCQSSGSWQAEQAAMWHTFPSLIPCTVQRNWPALYLPSQESRRMSATATVWPAPAPSVSTHPYARHHHHDIFVCDLPPQLLAAPNSSQQMLDGGHTGGVRRKQYRNSDH